MLICLLLTTKLIAINIETRDYLYFSFPLKKFFFVSDIARNQIKFKKKLLRIFRQPVMRLWLDITSCGSSNAQWLINLNHAVAQVSLNICKPCFKFLKELSEC